MDLGLRGKIIIVTGGAKGIGEAIAKTLVQRRCLARDCGKKRRR
jgi:NAD(P)-dependent dehydrogenase (short-subunit alcohol dehydrogenase family)